MGDLFSKDQILEMIGHDQNELKILIEMFIDLCPKMLDEIDFSIAKGDFKTAGDVAHKLKSSVRLWDISEVVDDVIFLEINGKNLTNTEILASKAMVVRNVLEKVLKQMKEEI